MRSMRWKRFRPPNAALLSVPVRLEERSRRSVCAISVLACQRIGRTESSIISFPQKQKERAWVWPSPVQLRKLTPARLEQKTPTGVAPVSSFTCPRRKHYQQVKRHKLERVVIVIDVSSPVIGPKS